MKEAIHGVMPLSPLTLPLHGMRLIEASAGTGKTFTIAALYLRLVLGHGVVSADPAEMTAFSRALSPRDILVVTFTRAATEELRGRIRTRLQEAANALRLDALPQDPILATLHADYEARGERMRAVYVLQQAAESMDEAAIYTIHSWCQQVLQQHAFESGAGFNRRLQQDQKTLLETCVQDYWRSYFYALDRAHVQWLRAQWKSPDALLKVVQNALKHNEKPRSLTAPLMLEACFERLRELQRLCAHSAGKIAQWVDDVIARDVLSKTSYPEEKLRMQVAHLLAWSQLDSVAYPEHAMVGAQGLEWWSWRQLLSKAKKGKSCEAVDFFVAVDAFLAEFVDKLMVIDCIEHAASWVQQRLANEKRRLATLHFDDMVNDVYFALTGPYGERLAEALRGRFPIALIDEFQDTDERQYAAFKVIYANALNNGLLLIGDPKQAIYSFRGADIFTYLQARKDTQGRHYSLDTNYRSVPALVSAVNHVFDLAARGVGQTPFVFEGIPFVPVHSRPATEKLMLRRKRIAPMTLWQLQGTDIAPKVYQQRMAEHAADTIATLLLEARQQQAGFVDGEGGYRPLRAADMAVLIRNRNEASVIREALSDRGVRSVYLSERDTVFATQEAHTLLALLQAVAMPEDERRLRVALAEPHLRLSLTDLDALQHNEFMWEEKVEQFKEFRQHWQQHGVLPMLRCVLQAYGVPHYLLTQAGGERVLTNLLHLSEWLQSAAATLEGEHALIRHLQEKIRLAEQDDNNEELTLRLESDEQLLKIITIHKSKGLEYPLVFLPFVCSPGRESKPPYVYHDANGHKQVYWDDGDQSAREAAETLYEKEQLAEDLRLFYVAMTRAKHACWLGMAEVTTSAGKNKPSRVLHRNPLAWLLAGKATLSAEEYRTQLQALVVSGSGLLLSPVPLALPQSELLLPAVANGPSLHDARQMSRSLVQRWTITSYTGIVWGAIETVVEAEILSSPLLSSVPEENVLQEEHLLDQQIAVATLLPSMLESTMPIAELEGMHGFPAGAQPGTFLHEVLEWAGEEGFDRFCMQLQSDTARAGISEQLLQLCQLRGYEKWHPLLLEWLQSLLQLPLSVHDKVPINTPLSTESAIVFATPSPTPLQLGALSLDQYQIEMEFWLALDHLDQQALDRCVCASEFPGVVRPQLRANTLEGMLKGFVDLLCEHEGRYYILDYKSNRLGTTHQDYTQDAMRDAVLHHRYDVQYALYTLALHRLLSARLGSAYDYDTHIGGAIYLFLRGVDAEGHGVFVRRIPYATIEALENSLGGAAQ